MSHDASRPIEYSCPYCEGPKIETAASAPYVRGFLLAYQVGTKRYIGCTSCVRKKVAGEAGLSALIGWFSVTALVINPFLIVYNLVRLPFIRVNYDKARKILQEAGIPEDQAAVDVTGLSYCLAAAMIAADGEIEPQELATARALGKGLFDDFDDQAFLAVMQRAKNLPSVEDMATLLREVLTEDGKKALCTYLWKIASADGHVDPAEKKLLLEIAGNLGFEAGQLASAA